MSHSMNKLTGKFLNQAPIIAVIALLCTLYFPTCPKDLTWGHNAQDTGDIITAAHILGIAHPTGYALFTLIGHIFTMLDFSFLSSRPVVWNNPAFKMTLFVILTSLANIYLFWRIQLEVQQAVFKNIAGTLLGSLIAAIGALALGTGYLYWSQTIVPEVYILNIFFINLNLLLILRMRDPEKVNWPLIGFTIGLGVFHHLTFVLTIPAFIILAIFILPKPSLRQIGLLLLGFIISSLVLLYFPIRSAMNPPLDTSNAETLTNFWRHISAEAYREFLFEKPVTDMFTRMSPFNLLEQYGVIGGVLILWGYIASYLKRDRVAHGLLGFSILSIGPVLIHASNYNVSDQEVFFLPALAIIVHLMAFGLTSVVSELSNFTSKLAFTPGRWLAVVVLVIIAFAWQASQINHAFTRGIDISDDMEAKAYGSQAFAVLEPDAIVLSWYDDKTYSLLYHRYVLFAGFREDVDIVLLQQVTAPWWWENVGDGHPDIKMTIPYTDDRTEIVRDIIAANIGERPIYTAWPGLPLPENYRLVSAGDIYRIISEDEYSRLMGSAH